MPPIDMSAVREALQRRLSGEGGMPAVQQQTQPGGTIPTGGPNVPGAGAPPMPAARPAEVPNQSRQAPAAGATPTQQAAGVAQTAQGLPDEETRKLSKQLLMKLVQFL